MYISIPRGKEESLSTVFHRGLSGMSHGLHMSPNQDSLKLQVARL